MGNVNMEASQINYRGGESKMSVEQAIKEAGSYTLPTASADTLGGVKVGSGLSIEAGVLSADDQLPGDPETDGVKVLTATTSGGETVKSWEEPASGGVDYSTTETDTGIKWIDGKAIFRKVITNMNTTLVASTLVSTGVSIPNVDTLISCIAIADDNVSDIALSSYIISGELKLFPFQTGNVIDTCILEYTKTTT